MILKLNTEYKMKLTEIRKINKSIIVLSGLEVEFGEYYNRILLSYKILYNTTGMTSDPYLKSKAVELQSNIERFVNYQFHRDQDIDLLKKLAFEIYKKLDNFK